MEITVQQVTGVCFSIESHGRRILCDQPLKNGGTGLGLSPPELLLASLGSCAAWCAHRFLAAKSLPATGLLVTVTEEMATSPVRLDHFRIAITLPPLTDEQHASDLRSSVEQCLIHYTLLHPPSIQVTASVGHISGTADPAPHSSEVVKSAAPAP
jgi:uncharacterized OsmC-like protein